MYNSNNQFKTSAPFAFLDIPVIESKAILLRKYNCNIVLPTALTDQEILTQARQINDSSWFEDKQDKEEADRRFKNGMTTLYWPDGVIAAYNDAEIYTDAAIFGYKHGRHRLEEWLMRFYLFPEVPYAQ